MFPTLKKLNWDFFFLYHEVKIGTDFENYPYVLLVAQCFWALCPARPLHLIWWLTFQVPDQWNSINVADLSGTRPMELNRSGWFFQVPDGWNSINLVIEISKHSAPLYFEYELGWTAFLASGTHSAIDFKKKKTEKTTFKKLFFPTWKMTFLENHPRTDFSKGMGKRCSVFLESGN